MARHVARLSSAEAGRRMADAKALRDLPEVAEDGALCNRCETVLDAR